MSATPLKGVRVLDLTTVVVGPVCTLRLAQYGAEVIKVESPDGDLMRSLGGPSPTGKHSGAYLHFNRNKRAVCLDLKSAAGREGLMAILATCDVLVSNMRPAALARLGLDPDSVRRTRPELIHCTITGYGPGGPYRDRPAYDSVVQGASGVAGLGLRRDGKPSYAPLLLCDHVTGEIAAGAIAAAIAERARTGVGSVLEVPMFETMAAFVLQEHMAQASFEPAVGPSGDTRMLDPGAAPLKTADGWISLTVNTNAQVHAFLHAVGKAELISDPRFATVKDRVANMKAWFAIRDAALAARPTAEWLDLFVAVDVPAMPCHTLESLQEDPHLTAAGLIVREAHPTEGAVRGLRPTIVMDGGYAPLGEPAQAIGWETRGVLAECGVAAGAIEDWVQQGAAVDGRAGSKG
ncbi:MAG: caiB [Caulobacter sp.]|nr:caiB [Caulobacter sp.]